MNPDSPHIIPPVVKLLTFPVVPLLLAKIVAPLAGLPMDLPESVLGPAASTATQKFMAQAGHRRGGLNE